MDLGDLKNTVILIGLIVLIAACSSIALISFSAGLGNSVICSGTYSHANQTRIDLGGSAPCMNQSGGVATIFAGSSSPAYNISIQGNQGVYNTSTFMGTIGTVSAVAVLIGIVVMAFRF